VRHPHKRVGCFINAQGAVPFGVPTATTVPVKLLLSNEYWGERVTTFDVKIAKNIRSRAGDSNVGVDIYNFFNSDAVTMYQSTYHGRQPGDAGCGSEQLAPADWTRLSTIVPPAGATGLLIHEEHEDGTKARRRHECRSPATRPRSGPHLSRLQSSGLPPRRRRCFSFSSAPATRPAHPSPTFRPQDVLMSENGVSQQVVKSGAAGVPMKLTIAVDNGLDSAEALAHYRSGLTGLVEGAAVRRRNHADRDRAAAAHGGQADHRPHEDSARPSAAFAPEQARPRFSDALVEYSERLREEAKDPRAFAVPAGAADVVHGRHRKRGVTSRRRSKKLSRTWWHANAKVNSIIVSTGRLGDASNAAGSLDLTLQSLVRTPCGEGHEWAVRNTGCLEPPGDAAAGVGARSGVLHARQIKQFRVTVERSRGGDLQSPRIELARPGLRGTVTLDGHLP